MPAKDVKLQAEIIDDVSTSIFDYKIEGDLAVLRGFKTSVIDASAPTDVIIPHKVIGMDKVVRTIKEIGGDAKEGTSGSWGLNLKSATLHNKINTIGYCAFSNCEDLTNIIIPDSVTLIGRNAFDSCALASIIIPSSVTMIDFNAFKNCENLVNITLPDSTISIKDNAFWGCRGLKTIYCSAMVEEILGQRYDMYVD